jgi:hypothetical protein
MEELRFSIDFEEIPVNITGKDGVEKKYVLRELTGKQRGLYLNNMSNRMIVSDGKIVGIKDFEGLEASLICKSLFDEENKPVPIGEIQEFPGRVIKQLFAAAQKLSGLNEEGIVEAKNG